MLEAAKHKLMMMSHDECKAALTLFWIFYCPNILLEVVFTNAQVILDHITELVCCSHALRTGDSSTDAVSPLMLSSEKIHFCNFDRAFYRKPFLLTTEMIYS